jgi:Tfp pilus assembly protein PilF
MNLGLQYASENHLDKAEAELKIALSLDPSFSPAAVNLADLYRGQNRDDEGKRVPRDGLSSLPNDASLEHALGLLMVRQKHGPQGLELLAAVARSEPGNARYVYVYAVALDGAGETNAAIEALERSIKAHPYDRDSLAALVTFSEQASDHANALTYAQRLDEIEPENAEVRRILNELRAHQHS